MKKLFCGALAALMTLSLAGCRTAGQPDPSSPPPSAPTDTPVISTGPETALPDYVSDFRFDMLRAYGDETDPDRSTAYALTGEQAARLIWSCSHTLSTDRSGSAKWASI